MIVLFTDFGQDGPYVGQMHAVLAQSAPGTAVIDLFHDVPRHGVQAAAYLLPAYSALFPPDTVFVCVVDPGVGGPRRPVMLRTERHWYLAPDNGLLELVARRAREASCQEITWRPRQLSASFHGRDLFAPVAAMLARGQLPASAPATLTRPDPEWPDDLPQVVYIDRFGNVLTGLRAGQMTDTDGIGIGGQRIPRAITYSQVQSGALFWYENSNGLVELAANQGSAAQLLGLSVGDRIDLLHNVS